MKDTTDLFADKIFKLLADEENLNPIDEHRDEIVDAICEVIVGVICATSARGFQNFAFRRLGEHIAALPERLNSSEPSGTLH